MRALFAVVATCALLSGGCVHYDERNTLVPLAIALPEEPPEASFARLLRITRALGYHVDFADVHYGVIGTHTRAQVARRDGVATIVVQLYTDHGATLTVLGGVPMRGERTRVSDQVRREAVALAQALEAGEMP